MFKCWWLSARLIAKFEFRVWGLESLESLFRGFRGSKGLGFRGFRGLKGFKGLRVSALNPALLKCLATPILERVAGRRLEAPTFFGPNALEIERGGNLLYRGHLLPAPFLGFRV